MLRMANTFNLVRSWVAPKYLKTVGDMLMFWIPREAFRRRVHTSHCLQGLAEMIREGIREDKFYQRLKGAITRCDNALEISFIKRQTMFMAKIGN